VIRALRSRHAYEPKCLETATLHAEPHMGLDDIDDIISVVTTAIGDGRCPRCFERGLVRPTGSLVTPCRCTPVCAVCSAHEVLGNLFPASCWPHTFDVRVHAGLATPAVITSDSDGVPVLLNRDGVSAVRLRPDPGGFWVFHLDDARTAPARSLD
jgi:hypothetical protein